MKKKLTFWIILAILTLYLVAPKFYKVIQLEKQRDGLQNDIRGLYQKNQRLENEVRLIKEDPIYIEYIARKKFRKAKEGEIVYEFVDEI